MSSALKGSFASILCAIGLSIGTTDHAIVIGNIQGASLDPVFGNAIDTSSIASNGQAKAVSFIMPTGQDWLLVDATLWTVGLDPNSGSTPDLPYLYIALYCRAS